jgi:hypothetical protein
MSWLDCPYTCIVGGDHLLRGVHDGGDGIPTIFIRAPDDAPDIVFYLHVGHTCARCLLGCSRWYCCSSIEGYYTCDRSREPLKINSSTWESWRNNWVIIDVEDGHKCFKLPQGEPQSNKTKWEVVSKLLGSSSPIREDHIAITGRIHWYNGGH